MASSGHRPERRCVGCGTRRPQAELIRFHIRKSEDEALRVVPDAPAERLGRGAYLCPRLACLELAFRRRGFQRAFRAAVEWDENELRGALKNRPEDNEQRQVD
ncbi:MAG TPA: YlxR family protein [Thermoleophilia bacterium]|nr:YlxR family protein [Thermoleophilia bacterium]